jgi:hypothetical protein
VGPGNGPTGSTARCNKSAMGGQARRWMVLTCPQCRSPLSTPTYRTSGDLGSICLTSTAIRLRSTRTTPLAIGRLLARILTSSASVASNSMMAPRLRRIT